LGPTSWKAGLQRRTGHPGGQQVEHEPATSDCGKGRQQHPELQEKSLANS